MARKILLGTDWWTDCDDAVALRVISRFVRDKRIELSGVCINACMEYSVASLDGFLLADGMCGIPVGIDRAATDFGGEPPYQRNLARRFCPDVTNDDADDAVRLYRRILAESNEKIEIIEIGFLQAIVAALKSTPDDISEKSGMELFREKVAKVWVMAGKWDADGEKEHNFCLNQRSRTAGHEFCELCPVPVTFLGWEVGYGVITGNGLTKDDHLCGVLCDHGSENGRHSWDPMLVLMALIGDEGLAGYDAVGGYASVDADTGANHFAIVRDGPHKFVRKKYNDVYYENAINALL